MSCQAKPREMCKHGMGFDLQPGKQKQAGQSDPRFWFRQTNGTCFSGHGFFRSFMRTLGSGGGLDVR